MVTLSQLSPYFLILFELRDLEHSLSFSSSLQFLSSLGSCFYSLCLWTYSSWSYHGVTLVPWITGSQVASVEPVADAAASSDSNLEVKSFVGDFPGGMEGWIERPNVRFIKFQLRPILSFSVAPGWPKNQRFHGDSSHCRLNKPWDFLVSSQCWEQTWTDSTTLQLQSKGAFDLQS